MDVIKCRTSASKETWETFEGTFSLSTMPQRVIFYLEGPSPGLDLLIKSVVITCVSPKKSEVINYRSQDFLLHQRFLFLGLVSFGLLCICILIG